ncbi:MAG: MFS transporter, partial [Steroidobacteraceae bacterium]
FGLLGIYTAGTLVHLVPMLIDRGTTPSHAALAMSVLGIALIIGRLVTGYLLDRFFAARVAIGFLLCPVLALAAFALGASGDAVIVGAILLGLGMGSEMDLLSYLISRYLGLKAYGQLYGLTYAAFSFGAGIGPIIMGYVHQSTGGYTPALWTLCVLTICALLPFLTLGPYPALPTSSADAGTRVVMGESSEQTAI